MQEYENLAVTLDGDVLRIAIDRPDALNAVNAPLHTELAEVFDDAYDADARVVVLTGNGDAFSAGGDVNWMKESVEEPESSSRPPARARRSSRASSTSRSR
ncbi:enoyl-CoA hydratase-related protein [Natrinema sp. SYSU A 869]|uniref:enoyl-CoA hydratase/isomerase family protein n=1 Tax=Natrinema sp. SYSU A 869 TaxID=2871694 RepID=UPI002102609C|nr:enoyl-CoA hydratase-related protein [Natrinema sp. SYSU A 869]